MNLTNTRLNELISELSETFGKISYYNLLKREKTVTAKPPSLLFTTNKGTFVYHPTKELANIIKYKSKLEEKNIPQMISSPIISIHNQGFITKFVEGEELNTLSQIDLPAVAELQAKFHQIQKYDLTSWNEKINNLHRYLLQNSLVTKRELFSPQFSTYGLIHGDYSLNNLVNTPQGIVSIDLEHVLEGPIAFDLARPLLRICHNKLEQENYLNSYFQGRQKLNQEELDYGIYNFFLVQLYDRHTCGRLTEAQVSLKKLREVLK